MTRRYTKDRDWDSEPYKAWRKAVRLRDKSKCRWCGSKRGIQSHHIKPWSKFPSLRYTVSNGITLCRACHNKVKKKEHIYEELFRTILALGKK